jgi:acetyltransferase-like isoleucine patch superfamily enzyme
MVSVLLAFARHFQTWLLLAGKSAFLAYGKNIHVGRGSSFWAPESITIGNGVYIGKAVLIECNVEIGEYALIANRVAFVGRHDHDFKAIGVPVRFSPWIGSKKHLSPYRGIKTIVENDVWIGYGATILSGVTLGRGTIVAAGSVVTKNTPAYAIVAGNPAVVVGHRFSSAETISAHENAISNGRFVFSERGYDHWIVEPGNESSKS